MIWPGLEHQCDLLPLVCKQWSRNFPNFLKDWQPCHVNLTLKYRDNNEQPLLFYITSRLNVMQAAVHNISGRQSHNGSDTELFLSLLKFRWNSVREKKKKYDVLISYLTSKPYISVRQCCCCQEFEM